MDVFFTGLLIGIAAGGLGAVAFRGRPLPFLRRAADPNGGGSLTPVAKELGITIPSTEELLTSIPIGIGLVRGRTMIWANPAMSSLIGYSPEEYRGRDSRLLYNDDEEYMRVGAILARDLAARGEAEVESILRRKGGRLLPCLFHMVGLSGEKEKMLSLIAITDISLPKAMQEALREKGEKYQAIFQNLPVGIFRSTLSGRFLEINDTLASLFGYADPEVMIRDVRSISRELYARPAERDLLLEAAVKDNRMLRREILFKRKDGSTFPADMLLRAVRSADGEISYVEGIIEDISERKQQEEQIRAYQDQLERRVNERTAELEETRGQLIEAERMASLGSLMGGVAHEINNPVGVALTASSHLTSRSSEIGSQFENEELTRAGLEAYLRTAGESSRIITRNLERAREFIEDIKQVAVDQNSAEARRFEVCEYLSTILTSLKPLLKRAPVSVELDCPEEITISGYPGALSHVLTNLIVNSLTHAFPEGRRGTISVSARRSDDSLILSVADDGIGIDEAIRARIFEPYFTTRREQGGSGLGLHIVAQTVTERLGGSVELEEKRESGARFIVTIPLDGGPSS